MTTFKFNKTKGNWFLYKDHFKSYKFNDDHNGNALVKERDKLETEKNFGIVSLDKFNIYSAKGH